MLRYLTLNSATIAALLLLAAASGGCRLAAVGNNIDGVQLSQQGYYPAALQKFQQAVVNDGDNPDSYYNMARAYHEMGLAQGNQEQLSKAEDYYHECLDRSADHVDCHRALAVLLVQTGRSDSAFTLLKNWAARSPQVADSRIELARLYEEFGDKESAKVHLQEAIRTDQKVARAWTALARIEEEQGDLRQAQVNYMRSYHLNGFQPGVAERIAAIQRSTSAGLSTTNPDTRWVTPGTAAPRY